MDELLVNRLTEEILDYIQASCDLLGEELITYPERRTEFEELFTLQPVNDSIPQTQDSLYNNPILLQQFIEERLDDPLIKGITKQVLDKVYAQGHDALRIAILRIRGDKTEYAFDPVSLPQEKVEMPTLRSGGGSRKKKEKREAIGGLAIVHALRWMGAQGWSRHQAEEVCKKLLKRQPKKGTFQINMGEGKKGKNVPVITKEQEALMKNACPPIP